MSRSGLTSVTPAYAPTNGVISDFENLFRQFESLKSVRYTQFLQIWKQMQMSFIFAGRQTDRECREFTEECLKLALAYCLDSSLQVKVFGLYLMYGLYFKYPFLPRVKIRVTLSDWKELMILLDEIRKQQHLDAEYVFLKLCYERAFQFVATITECMPTLRSSTSEAIFADTQHQKLEMLLQQKSIISELFESDTIDQLAVIHEEYHRVKCALAGPSASQPSASLNVIDNGLIHTLTKFVTSHEDWRKTKIGKKINSRRRRDSGGHTTSESEGDSEVDSEVHIRALKSHGALRAEIKDRAFSSSGITTSYRRYRKPVLDEGTVLRSSPIKKVSKTNRMSEEFSVADKSDVDDSDAESSSSFVISMPCLMTENARKQKGSKKKIHNESDSTEGAGICTKRRGRPKKVSNTNTAADCGVDDLNDAVDKSIKKRRGHKKGESTDDIPAEVSLAKLDETAQLTKKQRKSKKVELEQSVDDDYISAADDVVVQKVEKKRRRSRKTLDNSTYDQNADDLQELDITVDEHGDVHVHFSEDQQEQHSNDGTPSAKKRVKSKKVKTEIKDAPDGDTFNRWSDSSPNSPAKKRGRYKKNKARVSFNLNENESDVQDKCDSEVTHLPSPQIKKRGRPKKSTNTSCEIASSDNLHETSPQHTNRRKRTRPTKLNVSDNCDSNVQTNVILQPGAAASNSVRRISGDVTTADVSVHRANVMGVMLNEASRKVSSNDPKAVVVKPLTRNRRLSSSTSSLPDAVLVQSSQLTDKLRRDEYDDRPAANCDDVQPIVIMPQTDDFDEHACSTTVKSSQRTPQRASKRVQ